MSWTVTAVGCAAVMRVVWRGVLARRWRFAGAALAIVTGVALVSGTLLLAGGAHRSYAPLVHQVTGGVDVYVRGPERDTKQGIGDFAPVPGTLVDQVRSVAGAAQAEGEVVRVAQLVATGGTFLQAGRPTYVYSLAGLLGTVGVHARRRAGARRSGGGGDRRGHRRRRGPARG